MTSLTEQQKIAEANKHRSTKIKLEAAFVIILRRLLRRIAKELRITYAQRKTLSAFQFQNAFHDALVKQYARANKVITTAFVDVETDNKKSINDAAFATFHAQMMTTISTRLLYILATTQKDINTAINRFIGFNKPDNLKLLEQLFIDSSAYRAQLIAITETQNAVELKKTKIAEQYTQQDNHVLNKTWITILDGKERPAHGEAFGQTVPQNTLFIVMDEYLMYPGDTTHGATPANICNCRCSAIYESGRVQTAFATLLGA
jgi:hypothetical protein